MMYMYHNFLIHSSVNGHLGCFLAIVDSAAMNTGVAVSKFSVHCFDILKKPFWLGRDCPFPDLATPLRQDRAQSRDL